MARISTTLVLYVPYVWLYVVLMESAMISHTCLRGYFLLSLMLLNVTYLCYLMLLNNLIYKSLRLLIVQEQQHKDKIGMTT